MAGLWALLVLALAVAAHGTDCSGINMIKLECKSSEEGYKHDVFWVGGRYVNAAIELLTFDQMYFEKLTPLKGVKKPYPIVLFHGGGVSRVT